MDYVSFTDFLDSVLSNFSGKETHALIYVGTYPSLRSPTRGTLELELQTQADIPSVCAELPSGDILVFLQRMTLDGALRIARQLRYAIERALQPEFELTGSLGVIEFGSFEEGSEMLIQKAKRTATEARNNHRNRIKYLTIS